MLKHFLYIALVAIVFISCTKDKPNTSKIITDNAVTFKEAEGLVDKIISSTNFSTKSSLSKFKIKGNRTFYDKDSLPYFHILNLENAENRAFIIIAGDKREMPILAYSTNNGFYFDSIPYGVVDWLNTEMECIDKIREGNVTQNKFMKKMWENIALPSDVSDLLNSKREDPIGSDPNENPCGTMNSFSVGPLLQTAWGQECVYNEQCPTGCSTMCNHVRVGCVATAMAQIMNYHKYPNTYNWSILQNRYELFDLGSVSANEIARLMKDAGSSVNMNYACDVSTANVGQVNNALEDDYNYSSGGDYADFIDKVVMVGYIFI
jgi:streptopain